MENEKKDKDIKKISKKKVKIEKEIKEVSCVDLENKFLLIRVGTESRPATESDISEVQEKIEELFKKHNINCLAFVTHHAITIELIEKTGDLK